MRLLLAPMLVLVCVSPAWPTDVLDPDTWLEHARRDLGRYWMHPDALGTPPGRFPTFRCNDGSAMTLAERCGADLPAEQVQWALDHSFTRMVSRQTYTYGVLFHLTGDPEALKRMRQGADYLMRERFVDEGRGGVIAVTKQGTPVFKADQRTAQDLAYANVGLAMHYYLTRDPDVRQHLVNLKRYIFETYAAPDGRQLLWVLEASSEGEPEQRELVAQLDQINAYLLLATPHLPRSERRAWERDLRRLVEVLRQRYYDIDDQRFWGGIHDAAARSQDGRHNDHGHTIKAFWMIRQAGALLDEPEWVRFAESGMRTTLKRALVRAEDGNVVWSEKGGQQGSSWWTYTELDQAAAVLSLADPSMNDKYLGGTYDYWLRGMTDARHGGVWTNTFSSPETRSKQFHWKSGYHEAEHALVAYITTAANAGEPVQLYFALPSKRARVRPYFFEGRVTGRTGVREGVQRIRFTDVR